MTSASRTAYRLSVIESMLPGFISTACRRCLYAGTLRSRRTLHLLSWHLRSPLGADQLGPDLVPVSRPEIPALPGRLPLDGNGQQHKPLEWDVLRAPLVNRRRFQAKQASHLCGAAQGIDYFGRGWHGPMLGAPNIQCQGTPNATLVRIAEE